MNRLNTYAEWARQPRTLLRAFLTTLLIGLSFLPAAWATGGILLDELFTPETVASSLAAMSSGQKVAHAFITLSADTLYPLAYGTLLLGLIARYGTLHWWRALPLIAVVFDLCENATQVALLAGAEGLIGLKCGLTLAKFASLAAAMLCALGLAVAHLLRHGTFRQTN